MKTLGHNSLIYIVMQIVYYTIISDKCKANFLGMKRLKSKMLGKNTKYLYFKLVCNKVSCKLSTYNQIGQIGSHHLVSY